MLKLKRKTKKTNVEEDLTGVTINGSSAHQNPTALCSPVDATTRVQDLLPAPSLTPKTN